MSTYLEGYPSLRECIKREIWRIVNSGLGTFVCGTYAKDDSAKELPIDMVCRIIKEFHLCKPYIMRHFNDACFKNSHTMKTLVFHQLLEDCNAIIFLIDYNPESSGGHLVELGITETLAQIYDGGLNIFHGEKTVLDPSFNTLEKCWILLKEGVKPNLSPMLYGGVIEFFEHKNKVLEHDGTYQSLQRCIKEIEIRSTGKHT